MDRRKFLALSASAVATATAKVASAEDLSTNAGDSPRPNFLFFIADDLMYRTIGSVNNPEVRTPHIDALVRSGCYFSHCFHQGAWSGAVCVPSRTMLNTGLSTFHANRADVANQAFDKPMWGQALRESGYDTWITGKWHLDAVGLQRSFSEQGPVGPGYLPSTPDQYNRPDTGNHWDPANEALMGHWLNKPVWLGPEHEGTQHSSELYADAAIHHLTQELPKRTNPFFMYVGFNAPHDPRQAPQAFLDMYPVDKIQVPPNFLPEHPFDQGEHFTRDEMLAPFPRTPFDVQTHRREYYALISHMDAQIGRVLDALEKSGRAQNTYVILTADHGLAVGEHGLMGKQNQYECSMRMPLLLRGPGIRPGKVVDEMVYQHSMYATTCDLAGVPIPSHVEFPSLVPMLHDEQAKPVNDCMFGWLEDVQRSIRTREHKLIFYPKLNRYQVFDLKKDPWEMHDLVDDPEYATVKADLLAKLREKQRQLGDPMVVAKPPTGSGHTES